MKGFIIWTLVLLMSFCQGKRYLVEIVAKNQAQGCNEYSNCLNLWLPVFVSLHCPFSNSKFLIQSIFQGQLLFIILHILWKLFIATLTRQWEKMGNLHGIEGGCRAATKQLIYLLLPHSRIQNIQIQYIPIMTVVYFKGTSFLILNSALSWSQV